MKSDLQKVWISNISRFRLVGFQIPAVPEVVKLNSSMIQIPTVRCILITAPSCFPVVQKQDGCHFVLFSNGLDHWKTKLLASLDHFIYTHSVWCIVITAPSTLTFSVRFLAVGLKLSDDNFHLPDRIGSRDWPSTLSCRSGAVARPRDKFNETFYKCKFPRTNI